MICCHIVWQVWNIFRTHFRTKFSTSRGGMLATYRRHGLTKLWFHLWYSSCTSTDQLLSVWNHSLWVSYQDNYWTDSELREDHTRSALTRSTNTHHRVPISNGVDIAWSSALLRLDLHEWTFLYLLAWESGGMLLLCRTLLQLFPS